MSVSDAISKNKQSKDGLISVIVPVYNAEKYLEFCVRSVLRQTYQAFELILVNDGSQDDSPELCESLAREDDRIRVVHRSNGGAGAARNSGLSVAGGEYITFIDSDDYVSENYLENLYSAAQSGHFDIVQCRYVCVTKHREMAPIEFSPENLHEITKSQALNTLVYNVSLWAKLYKGSVFQDFRIPEGAVYEDDATYYKLADRAKRIALLEQTLYYYYMSDGSIMRNNQKDRSIAFLRIYQERIQYFKEKDDPELLDGSYFRYCLILMLNTFMALARRKNKNDIGTFIEEFNQNYPKIRNCEWISWKYKALFACFHASPRFLGGIIGMVYWKYKETERRIR